MRNIYSTICKLGRSAHEITEATNFATPTIFKRLHKTHYNLPNSIVKLGRKPVSKEHEFAVLSDIVQEDNSLNLKGMQEKLQEREIIKFFISNIVFLNRFPITILIM